MSHPIIKTACVMAGFAVAALAANSAQACDPAPQEAATSSSMKVGVDARTGKQRPLTAAESAQLDAMTAKNKAAQAKNQAALAKSKGKSVAKEGPTSFVAANGMVVTIEPLMIETTASICPDGKVEVTHGTDPQSPEAAHE